MKTYFPYQLKYVGVLFVFIAIVLSCIGNVDEFMRGLLAGRNDFETSILNEEATKVDQTLAYQPYFSEKEKDNYLKISLILSLSGFILYLFSKEKSEDEFYQQLRAKCLTQALLVTWLFTGLIYWIRPTYQLNGFYILQLHLIFFTIIYVYNKKWKFGTE
ncbi:hypothetical protein ACT3CE_06945 [Marinifilum sp. RC60d5]|uniref:hypothetical protein n=1 Tax=Marinifilum sp. RC60d5 TaxID=3458414 RepID=UPI004036F2D6